jgi:SulP family sulfate permease
VRGVLGAWLARLHLPAALVEPITKGAPLVAVLAGSLLVWGLDLHETAGVPIVGAIPAGLPPLTAPTWDWGLWRALLPTAFAVAAVGVIESVSVAKSLASRRRQKVNVDQELVAVGAANLGAAFTGGYPVTGSFSRSVVNFTSGANTGLASIITALLVALTVVLLTPAMYFLPQAVLAGIIVGTILTLVDVPMLKFVWRYNKRDAAALLVTFAAVLEVSANAGLVVGMFAAMGLYLWRTSRPHIAILGRVGESEYYRDVLRAEVRTNPYVLLVRVDAPLYFANTKYIEDWLLRAVADHPQVKDVVLLCEAVNFIDASALRTLEGLVQELSDVGVTLHLAEVQDYVLDELERVHFATCLGNGRIFASAHEAMQTLGGQGVLAKAETPAADTEVERKTG